MFPLSNYLEASKTLLAVIVTALVVGLLAYFLHTWSVARIEASNADALEDQKEALNGQCQKDKQITEETSHAYQTQLTALRDQLAAVKRLQPNRCIPTVAKPAFGYDAAPPHPGFPRADGVFTDDLYDFAADAEQVGLQLDACQGFVKKVWSSREGK